MVPTPQARVAGRKWGEWSHCPEAPSVLPLCGLEERQDKEEVLGQESAEPPGKKRPQQGPRVAGASEWRRLGSECRPAELSCQRPESLWCPRSPVRPGVKAF